MATKKIVFIAFAIEDEGQRNLLKGQSLNTESPFEYIDMSVKEPYNNKWKERVRTRIRRSDGVIALVSRNSLSSSGQKWEIQCAKEENGNDCAAFGRTRTIGPTWQGSIPRYGPGTTSKHSSILFEGETS